MADYSQIRIKAIPAIFPNMSFEDVRITSYRINMQPDAYKEIYETSEKHKSLMNPFASLNIKIQSLYKNRYTLKVHLKENHEIDLLKIAGTAQIYTTDNDILNIYVIDIEYTKQGNTNNYVATINFYVLANDYESLNNYLIKENIRASESGIYHDIDLHTLTIFSDKTISAEFTALGNEYTIYSVLIPKYFSTELSEKSTEQSGIEYISNSIDFKLLRYTCYLTESEAILVKRYMPRCNVAYNLITGEGTATTSDLNTKVQLSVDANLVAGQYIRLADEIRQIGSKISEGLYTLTEPYNSAYSGVSYQYCSIAAVERVIPQIEQKELINIYECLVELKYSQIDFNNYV